MGSWFEKGWGRVGDADDLDGPTRLWVPEDGSKEVVFVDDVLFCVHEHDEPKGAWEARVTCLASMKDLDPVRKLFQIEVDAAGCAVPKLVPFNYVEILKPRSVDDVRRMR